MWTNGAGFPFDSALRAAVAATAAADRSIPGVALHLDLGGERVSWAGAAGFADALKRAPLSPEHPVRLASNTKTYVAAAVLRLRELGRLGLDDAVAHHLRGPALKLLAAGGYDPRAITLRHLLTHTSGLHDYADSGPFERQIRLEPYRRWERSDQLALAMEVGRPYGPPGSVFRYSDTGYILLGEVLEQVSGRSLSAALRELLGYSRLGLDETWMETLEPPPPGVGERAHQYVGDLDTWDWHPSCDLHGGGGVVATVGDLARFTRELFAGRVFDDPASADIMLTTVPGAVPGPDAYGEPQRPGIYRMGISVGELDGEPLYWHTGFWGTFAAYAPLLDVAVAGTLNQADARHRWVGLVSKVLPIARRARAELRLRRSRSRPRASAAPPALG